MMRSLVIKVGLLLAATAAIFWIGWDGLQTATQRSAPFPSIPARRHEPVASLDLNRATVEELTTLPGVGKVIADRIIRKRENSGLYSSVQQLLDIRGIGETRLARIRPRVHVSTDGTTASAKAQARHPARMGRRGS